MYHPRLVALAVAFTALQAAACSDKQGPDGRDSGGDDGVDGSSGGYRCKWDGSADNVTVPTEDEAGVAPDTAIRWVREVEPIWLDTPSCADGFWGYVERAPEWGHVWTTVDGTGHTTFADNGRITWDFEPDATLDANTEYYVTVGSAEHLWGGLGYSWLFTTGSSSSATATPVAARRDAP